MQVHISKLSQSLFVEHAITPKYSINQRTALATKRNALLPSFTQKDSRARVRQSQINQVSQPSKYEASSESKSLSQNLHSSEKYSFNQRGFNSVLPHKSIVLKNAKKVQIQSQKPFLTTPHQYLQSKSIIKAQEKPYFVDFKIVKTTQVDDIDNEYYDQQVMSNNLIKTSPHKARSSMLIMGVSGGFSHVLKGQRPSRASQIKMDETIIQNALAGTLEEEGAENIFLSEVGWATYLDKQGQSYGMNERVSVAQDGYFTPDVFSNPLEILGSWVNSVKRVASDPLSSNFMTISNDPEGLRTYGKGNEVMARTIKPKTKDMDPKMRVSGIPGFNLFGTPSSKQQLGELLDKKE